MQKVLACGRINMWDDRRATVDHHPKMAPMVGESLGSRKNELPSRPIIRAIGVRESLSVHYLPF